MRMWPETWFLMAGRIGDESDNSGMRAPYEGNTWPQQIEVARASARAAELRLAAQTTAARVLLAAQEGAASVLVDAEARAASVLLVAADEAENVLAAAHERALGEMLNRAAAAGDLSYTPDGELLVRFADTAEALRVAQKTAAKQLKDVQAAAAEILIREHHKAAALLIEARFNYTTPLMADEESEP